MQAVRHIPNYMSSEKEKQIVHAVGGIGQRLMRFIRARVASDADAEDVMQDVWQQLVTTLDSGPIEQVGAWLYRVARNRIIDRYRRPSMPSIDALAEEADDDDEGFDLAEFLLRDESTPRTEDLRHRFWEELYAVLAELPEEQRQVFVWHELEGLSFEEMAELTGENVNTLLSRKRYAVLRLRARLEPLRDEFLNVSRQRL